MNLRKTCAGVALLAAAGAAQAVYTLDITQNGANVVISGSGSLDLTGMTGTANSDGCGNGEVSNTGFCLGTGHAGRSFSNAGYSISGLTSSQSTILANSSTGDAVFAYDQRLWTPPGYVSNAALASTATFTGTTIAAMGIRTGVTRTFTLASGDTIVVNFAAIPPAPASVPTLSEYALLALASVLGMAGIFAARRRQR